MKYWPKVPCCSTVELLCIFGHLDGLKTLGIFVSGFCFHAVHSLEYNFIGTDFLLLLVVLCSRVESVSNEDNFYLRFIMV